MTSTLIFYSTADIESLLGSPLSSALPLVLKLCVNEEEDILLVALDIICLLVENGKLYYWCYMYVYMCGIILFIQY